MKNFVANIISNNILCFNQNEDTPRRIYKTTKVKRINHK